MEVPSYGWGAAMHDLDYVVELAKAYGNALITHDELQDELHSCSIETIMYGVNTFDEEYGHESAAAFVVARLGATPRGQSIATAADGIGRWPTRSSLAGRLRR